MRSERLPLIDYPWPVLHTSVVMVYRKPEVLHNFRLPLGPLSTTVAICLAASLVFVSLHLFCLELCAAASDSGGGKERIFFVKRERILRLLTIWEIVVRTAGAALLQERKLSQGKYVNCYLSEHDTNSRTDFATLPFFLQY